MLMPGRPHAEVPARTLLSGGLLERTTFRELVLAASRGRCALCPAPAVDAHHILDRKLFADGGYYFANGVAVCADCHWCCEITTISVEDVIAACGRNIRDRVLPPGFDPALSYDKWGNVIRADGWRLPGPLFHDEGARRALACGNVLWRFVMAPVMPA